MRLYVDLGDLSNRLDLIVKKQSFSRKKGFGTNRLHELQTISLQELSMGTEKEIAFRKFA